MTGGRYQDFGGLIIGDGNCCLADENCYIYLCGLKGMETGVLDAMQSICLRHGIACGTS